MGASGSHAEGFVTSTVPGPSRLAPTLYARPCGEQGDEFGGNSGGMPPALSVPAISGLPLPAARAEGGTA